MRVTSRRSGTSQNTTLPIAPPTWKMTLCGKRRSSQRNASARRVIAAAAFSIEPRFTRRPRLEALVHPVVLLRDGGDALLDVLVHAARIRNQVIGRKSLPRRLDGEHVARSARQHTRHARQNFRPTDAGNARQARDGRRGNAEERHENRVARAIVLVRQVVQRPALAYAGEQGPDALLAGEDALVAKAAPAVPKQTV